MLFSKASQAQKVKLGANVPSVPSSETLSKVFERLEYTPDMPFLEQKQFHLVFVYNEIMKGHRHHDYLGPNAPHLAGGFSRDRFSMWTKKLGKLSFPILLRDPVDKDTPMCRVQGEIYAVRAYQFPALDTHHRNGVEFTRQRIRVLVPGRKIVDVKEKYLVEEIVGKLPANNKYTTPFYVDMIAAWTYVGLPSYWMDQLGESASFYKPAWAQFEPTGIFKPRLEVIQNYYHFTHEEYSRR